MNRPGVQSMTGGNIDVSSVITDWAILVLDEARNQ
jgi:hypothetical protein